MAISLHRGPAAAPRRVPNPVPPLIVLFAWPHTVPARDARDKPTQITLGHIEGRAVLAESEMEPGTFYLSEIWVEDVDTKRRAALDGNLFHKMASELMTAHGRDWERLWVEHKAGRPS
jgi:hypothetical protein